MFSGELDFEGVRTIVNEIETKSKQDAFDVYIRVYLEDVEVTTSSLMLLDYLSSIQGTKNVKAIISKAIYGDKAIEFILILSKISAITLLESVSSGQLNREKIIELLTANG